MSEPIEWVRVVTGEGYRFGEYWIAGTNMPLVLFNGMKVRVRWPDGTEEQVKLRAKEHRFTGHGDCFNTTEYLVETSHHGVQVATPITGVEISKSDLEFNP